MIIMEGYFSRTYKELGDVLSHMYTFYPEWEDHEVYDELNKVIEWFFGEVGVMFEDTEEGVYIAVGHPEIELYAVNLSPDVKRMIDFVVETEGAPSREAQRELDL